MTNFEYKIDGTWFETKEEFDLHLETCIENETVKKKWRELNQLRKEKNEISKKMAKIQKSLRQWRYREKNKSKYECKKCNFGTHIKTQYERHVETNFHKMIMRNCKK